MPMLKQAVVLAAFSFLLGACKTLPLDVATKDACPVPFNANGCAPTAGESLVYTKFPPVIPIINGTPRYQDFVGAVLLDDDKEGTNPRYCGRQATPAFLISDFDVNLVPHTITYKHTLSGTSAASASFDLVAALRKVGIPDSQLQNVSANAKGIWNRLNNREANTEASFVVVKISVPAFNAFLSQRTPAHLQHCDAQMSSEKHVRLISAMSGYWVKSASEDATIKNELVAELQAALKGIVPDSKILSLAPELGQVANTALNKASGEHFVVRAVTFYNPKNHRLGR